MDNSQVYQYESLPGQNYIRLISFQRDNQPRPIKIRLSIYPLNSAPSYQCLSYTWGNPSSSYSEDAEMLALAYDSVDEIRVEGALLSVKFNLSDALEMLREHAIADQHAEHFWIDAICINQGSLEERASQVAIMSSIYSTAERVIVWIGREDEFTADAIHTITSLGNIPKEQYAKLQSRDEYNPFSELARVGATPVQRENWLGLIAFSQRPFFSRVWVAQEIILAKTVMLVCGPYQIPWQLMANTVSLIMATGWQHYVQLSYLRVNPYPMALAGIYRRMLQEKNLQLSRSLVYLETIRAGVTTYKHPAVFRYLLMSLRMFKASDDRDKIYALMGLAWKERPPFSTHPDALAPDYTLSVVELYTKVTRVMIQSQQNLRILGHVEDRSFRKLFDLPSWVPDFSSTTTPPALDSRLVNRSYNASKGLTVAPKLLDYYATVLEVAGFKLSTVKKVSDVSRNDIWEERDGIGDDRWIQIFGFAAEISEAQFRTLGK